MQLRASALLRALLAASLVVQLLLPPWKAIADVTTTSHRDWSSTDIAAILRGIEVDTSSSVTKERLAWVVPRWPIWRLPSISDLSWEHETLRRSQAGLPIDSSLIVDSFRKRSILTWCSAAV